MVAWPAMPSAGLALLVAVCSVYTATAEGQTAGLAVSSSEPWKPWSEDLTTPRESKAGKPSECDEVKSCSPSTSCPEKFVPAPSTDWVACCFDGVTDCIPEPATKDKCDGISCMDILAAPKCPLGELTKRRDLWRGCCFDVRFDCSIDLQTAPAPGPASFVPEVSVDSLNCPPLNDPPCDNPRKVAKSYGQWLSTCFNPETDCSVLEVIPTCDKKACPDTVPLCSAGRQLKPRTTWADCCFDAAKDCDENGSPMYSEQSIDIPAAQPVAEPQFDLNFVDAKFDPAAAKQLPVLSEDKQCLLPPAHDLMGSQRKVFVTDSPSNMLVAWRNDDNLMDLVEDDNMLGSINLEMKVFVSDTNYVPSSVEVLSATSKTELKAGFLVKGFVPVSGAYVKGQWNVVKAPVKVEDYVNFGACAWDKMSTIIVLRSGPATGVPKGVYMKFKEVQIRKTLCPPVSADIKSSASQRQCPGVADTSVRMSQTRKAAITLSQAATTALSFGYAAPFSICAWYHPQGNGSAMGGTILSKFNEGVGGEYVLAVDRFGFVQFVRAAAGSVVKSTVALPRNAYTHIAAVYDGIAMFVYLNGTLVGQKAASPQARDQKTDVLVGAAHHDGQPARFLEGNLDDLHVWNVARTRKQILEEVYHTWKLSSTDGLILDLDFNPASIIDGQKTLVDQSSSRFTGQVKHLKETDSVITTSQSKVPCTSACPDHCHKQGVCAMNLKCSCHSGFSGASCAVQKCGGTNFKECSGKGECVSGYCKCFFGYEGANCSSRVCAKGCERHGVCLFSGVCSCDKGFTGLACDKGNCPNNCHGNGICSGDTGQCECMAAFTGPSCADSVCPGNCSGHGACVGKTKSCNCDPKWGGKECQLPIGPKTNCVADCFRHGECNSGTCECDSDHSGEFCKDMKCPNGCSGHGKCKHGDCVCDKHYDSKVDCSVKLFCPNQCSGNGACIDGDCHCKMGFCGDACDEDLCPVDNTNGQICGGPVKGRCAAAGCECKSGFSGANCGFKEGWPFKCVTLCGDQCETKCSRALKPLETTNQQTNPGGYLSTDSKDYVDGHKGGHKGGR